MLKQLRRKFVAVNMLMVSLILLVVFSFQLYSSWRQITASTDEALRSTLQWGEAGPDRWQIAPPTLDNPDGEDTGQHIPVQTFCVVVTGEKALVIGDNVDISEDVLNSAIHRALTGSETTGTLPDLALSYLRVQTAAGTRIAFADTSWQHTTMRRQVLTSALILLASLIGFFFASLLFSRWATRPTEKSWKQQQQFIADASHELKTPLTVMLADTDILLSHPGDTVESQRKWVEYIRDEALRMKEMVEDMLFLARSDSAAKPDIPKTRVSLSDLCWNCLLSFEPVAFERGAQLTGEIAPDISLSAHQDQLRRLINILLDNGCKYCGTGGQVTLSLSQAGSKISLRVHNTGAIIPPEVLPHLFERFYRVDSSRSREAGGHGLGLAIAASIVQSHGGGISVTSREGDGTCFTVTLPVETKA